VFYNYSRVVDIGKIVIRLTINGVDSRGDSSIIIINRFYRLGSKSLVLLTIRPSST
jgi:hypothetical protein